MFLIKRGKLPLLESVLFHKAYIKFFEDLSKKFRKIGLVEYLLGGDGMVTRRGISNYLRKAKGDLTEDNLFWGAEKFINIGDYRSSDFYENKSNNNNDCDEKEDIEDRRYYWGDEIKVIKGDGKYKDITKYGFKKLSKGKNYVTEKDIKEYNSFCKELLSNPELLKKAKGEVESRFSNLKDFLEGAWVIRDKLSDRTKIAETKISDNIFLEVENFFNKSYKSNTKTEVRNRGNLITRKLDKKIKDLKSEYRGNRRAYLFGEMLPKVDIQLQVANTKIKAKYENLIDLKEQLRSKLNPDSDGYDSPIEALYSRQEYENTFDNANTLLEGAEIILNGPLFIGKTFKAGVRGAKAGIKNLRNKSAYIRGSKFSVKGMIKSKFLPTKGKVIFVPREADKKIGKILERDGGYVDKFGNVWKKGSSKTKLHLFEWDVQLSNAGKKQLGWASNTRNHVNISLDGKISH